MIEARNCPQCGHRTLAFYPELEAWICQANNVRRIDSTSVMTPQIADSTAGPLMPQLRYIEGPCSYREPARLARKTNINRG